MRHPLAGLLMLVLVAGCASRQAPVTAPVQPTPAAPARTAPGSTAPGPAEPAPPSAHPPRPTRKLSVADVAYVEVSTEAPDHRSALLRPSTHAGSITALVDALNTVEQGYPRLPGAPRLTAAIHLKQPGKSRVILRVSAESGELSGAWDDPWLSFDSPAVAKALADLEPLLQPQPKPGSQIWAVDPAGTRPPELLLTHAQPLYPAAFSPDGRYWLLTRNVGQEKGDFSAIPYLLDRTTGTLREGTRTDIRGEPAWSGNGFTINWPARLDLSLKEDRMSALGKALGVEPNVREVIHISFTGDGKRFAALVGPWGREEPVDLVLGNADGTHITVVPAAVRGTATQSGIVARVELSPDGEWLAIAGKGPLAIILVADVSVRERWAQLRESSGWIPITWSPDSRYVALAGRIYDQTGKLTLDISPANTVTWRPDSKAVVIHDYAQVQTLALDGTRTDLAVPDWSVPAGFLPDGRLLVFRTVYPAQP